MGDTVEELLDKNIKAAKTKDMAFAIIFQGKNAAIGVGMDETAAKKIANDSAQKQKISGSAKTGVCRWDKLASRYQFEIAEASPTMETALKLGFERDLKRKVALDCVPPTPVVNDPLPKTPPEQDGNGNGNGNSSSIEEQINPRMRRKMEFEQQEFDKRNPPPVKPVKSPMDKKLEFENQQYIKRTYPGRDVWDGKIQTVGKMPKEKQTAGYEIVARQVNETLLKVKDEKEIDESFRNEQQQMLQSVAESIEKARNQLSGGNNQPPVEDKGKQDVEDQQNTNTERRKKIEQRLKNIQADLLKAEKSQPVPDTTKPLADIKLAKAKVLQGLQNNQYESAEEGMDQLEKLVPLVIGTSGLTLDRLKGQIQTKKSLDNLANTLTDPKATFPPNQSKQIGEQTDRGVLGGGHGKMFKPVLKALADVEKSAGDKELDALELAAKAYLADYDERVNEATQNGNEQDLQKLQTDEKTKIKVETCKTALEKVRALRARKQLKTEMDQLPQGQWSEEQSAQANRIKAKMIVEGGGSKPLGDSDGRGASESFFLTDPVTKEKAFIFKPIDGEFDAGGGWPKGGGAPREVVVSKVNDTLRSLTGLDCGVSSTTLVSIDSPNVASEKNGNSSKRTGAIQNFVKIDKELNNRINGPEVKPKDFINQIPPQEIEKVAILDFATLQMDRQRNNLLVASDGNGNPKLIPIDAGNAMPTRKAFEGSRRQFTNNALFAGDEGQKPFSKEALDKINAIDEDEVAKGIEKANEEMKKLDPKAGESVGKDTIEMTRRSIRFLKKAAPRLTKVQIADAYANVLHKVFDAKPNEVDTAIENAILEEIARTGNIAEIEKIPNGPDRFTELGWPKKAFDEMKGDDPARLLKVLQKNMECPAAVAEIKSLTKEIGPEKIGFDPSAIKSLSERLDKLRLRRQTLDDDKLVNDPKLQEEMQKLGWDFTVDLGGLKRTKLTDNKDKAKLLRRMQAFIEAGGDEFLKTMDLDPAKMSPEEKMYESFGGNAATERLVREGLNPYLGPKIDPKIKDLEDVREYRELGGDAAYARAGGVQSVETSIRNRVETLNRFQETQSDPEVVSQSVEPMLKSLGELLNTIEDAKKKCEEAETAFDNKRELLSRYDAESNKPMPQEAQTKRLEELNKEDMEVSTIMKKFGGWNAAIISPWKTLQGEINRKYLFTDKRVQELNHKVTQSYDAYVAVFGAAQDLGQDEVDVINRAKKKTQGQRPTIENAIQEVGKLLETMTGQPFGAATKVKMQLEESKSIGQLADNAVGKTDQFADEQWDDVDEWDTKIRQSFEVVKANYRATKRAKANANDYLNAWGNDEKIQSGVQAVLKAVGQAETDYNEMDKLVTSTLKTIENLRAAKKVDI
ncbi:MAG TPA: hypothetical protein VHX65_16725 [Pirellulales bacterium]|nr:hypothetical protein [Pirellulales bacterium]